MNDEEVRIDRWLWAARCFKTRSQASHACAGGHVKVNDQGVRPAKTVRAGDRVEVLTAGGLRLLEIVALGERRGSATEARALYVDHTPPPPPREERPMVPTRTPGSGRPTKSDRRALRHLRGY